MLSKAQRLSISSVPVVLMPTPSFEVSSFLSMLFKFDSLYRLVCAVLGSEGVGESAGPTKSCFRENGSLPEALPAVQSAEDSLRWLPREIPYLIFSAFLLASKRLGWGLGDCKPTSFVLKSCEDTSLTLSLQCMNSGQSPVIRALSSHSV